MPVYLTEVQRDLFFSPLRPLFTNAKDGLHQCSECGVVLRSLLVCCRSYREMRVNRDIV